LPAEIVKNGDDILKQCSFAP